MPIYVNIKNKHRRICIGDLDRRISIFTRTLTTPAGTTPDYTLPFSNQNTVWAMLVTTRGVEVFDGINVKGIATHLFYIRYYAGVTPENWVQFNGNNYNILTADNLDERGEFLCLKCALTGDTADPVSTAGESDD